MQTVPRMTHFWRSKAPAIEAAFEEVFNDAEASQLWSRASGLIAVALKANYDEVAWQAAFDALDDLAAVLSRFEALNNLCGSYLYQDAFVLIANKHAPGCLPAAMFRLDCLSADNPIRRSAFDTYAGVEQASSTHRQEMFDYIRSLSPDLRGRPRGSGQWANREEFLEQVRKSTPDPNRAPTEEQIAQRWDCDVRQLRRWLKGLGFRSWQEVVAAL